MMDLRAVRATRGTSGCEKILRELRGAYDAIRKATQAAAPRRG